MLSACTAVSVSLEAGVNPTDNVLALGNLEPPVGRLGRCHLDIDTPHHRWALWAVDTKRLAIVVVCDEEATLNLRTDPPFQASLTSIDEMLALARWVIVGEGAWRAVRVASIAEILDRFSGLALLRRWYR